MEVKKNLIFSKSRGNKISRSIKVYCQGESYKLIYMKFDRTDPLIKDKLKGIKSKRILLDKKVFYIDNLSFIDINKMPSKDLTKEFLDSLRLF